MRFLPMLMVLLVLAGCGQRAPERAAKDKFITVEEWNKMPNEEKYDPYVLQRLEKSPFPKDKTPPVLKK